MGAMGGSYNELVLAPCESFMDRVREVLDSVYTDNVQTIGVEVAAFASNEKAFKKIIKAFKDAGFKVILFSALSSEEEEMLERAKASKYTVIHSHNPRLTAAALQMQVDVWFVRSSYEQQKLH